MTPFPRRRTAATSLSLYRYSRITGLALPTRAMSSLGTNRVRGPCVLTSQSRPQYCQVYVTAPSSRTVPHYTTLLQPLLQYKATPSQYEVPRAWRVEWCAT